MNMQPSTLRPAGTAAEPLLSVKALRVAVTSRARTLMLIDTADLTLAPREAVGIVGESGSAKTMLCRSLIGTLARHGATVVGGSIRFKDFELAGAGERVWRQVRGRHIGYIPQSSLAGLNPVLTVGLQLMEAVRVVEPLGRRAAETRALELLERVRIPRAKQVLNARSHELSGGMRQRVMIAAAIAQKPDMLIADEPTTALDVTVQREILGLLTDIRKEFGMALVLISHDLAVIESVCDQLVVMYAGATVESGPVTEVAARSRHPYTRSLSASRIDRVSPGADIVAIPGEPVAVGRWPAGCRFNPRCTYAAEECRQGRQPDLMPVGRQKTACIRWESLPA
jgi:oligopeptide/dipeptide ABC transporter ATP-binding protein